eukprot:6768174-Prymnesium_polylepis.1
MAKRAADRLRALPPTGAVTVHVMCIDPSRLGNLARAHKRKADALAKTVVGLNMPREQINEQVTSEIAADTRYRVRVDDVQYAVLEDHGSADDISADSSRLLAATFADDGAALRTAGCSDRIMCAPLERACRLAGRRPILGCSLTDLICEGRLAVGATVPRL